MAGEAAALAGAVPAPGSTQTVWANWVTSATTTAGLGTGMQTLATTLTGTSISMTAVWQAWNNTTTLAGTGGTYTATWEYTLTWPAWNTAAEETREERETREQAAAENRAAAAAREQERIQTREAAKTRALELLSFCLTPAQMTTYREKGWFEVRGSRGRRWRIRARGQSGNVDLMPEIGDERLASYCAHPPGQLPDADAHLAQMLALVDDEDGFERVANVQWRAA